MNLFELFVKIGVDDQASDRISKISSGIGKGLQTAANIGIKAVGVLSAATVAFTGALAKGITSTAQYGDTIDKMSQKMGLSAEAYQEWDFIMQHSGTSMEALKAGMKTLANAVESGNKAFERLSITQEEIATMNQEELFARTLEALQGVTDETERTYLAGQLLGRGATELGALLNMTAEETEEMRQELHELGGVMSDEAVSASATFQDSLQNTQVALNGVKNNLMSEFLPSLSLAMDGLAKIFSGDDSGLAELNEGIEQFTRKLSGFAPKVIEIFGNIFGSIGLAITKSLPKLAKAAVEMVKSFAKSFKQNAKTIINVAKDLVLVFIDGMVDMLPDVIDAGVELLSGVVSAVPEVLVKLAKTVPKIARTVANGLVVGTIEVAKAAISLFSPIVDKSEEATKSLEIHLSTLSSFNDLVAEFSKKTADLSSSLSGSGNTISEIDQDIAASESAITQILKDAFAKQEGLRQEDIANIEAYNQKIREKNEEKLGIYRDQQLAEYRKLMLDIANADAETLAKYTGQAQSALEESNKVVEAIYDARLVQIENFHKAQETIGSTAYEIDLQNAKAHRDEMLAVNQGYYDQTITAAAGASGQLVQTSIDSFAKVDAYTGKLRDHFNKWHLNSFLENNKEIYSALGVFDESIARYAKSLENLDYEAAIAFLNMQLSAKEAGVAIDSETADAIDTILGAFTVLPGEFGDVGREGLLTLAEGLEEKIPVLKNAGQMTSEEILDAMRQHLLGSEANKLTSDFLDAIQEGLNNGTLHVNINTDVVHGGGSRSFSVDGSHESGLDYVPYDGYIAELHKGERVLTASEASSYGGTSIGNITIHIDGAKYSDEHSLASAIALEIQNMTDRRAAVYA